MLKTSTNRTRPLVYNRVPKAASTSMIVVLQRLARRNHFGVTSAPAMQYWPRLTELRARLESLRPDHCYINHCSTLDDSRRQWLWINIVREPLAHYESCTTGNAAACESGPDSKSATLCAVAHTSSWRRA